ncbi:MAG: DNA (cytosine-5-)-methyltransferase [Prochlorothrix sp.]|nr:DNA (cytosine-5-)-methyltransferase [Prochlorothrix sp.]
MRGSDTIRQGKPIEAVELFAGIGGFRVACDRVGIQTQWANDIDPKAAQVYCDRFGAAQFHLGDLVTLLDSIPPHDLLTAGFPCQPFSSAGKKLGLADPRGTLLGRVVEVLDRHRPPFFVLENVKRLLSMDRGQHFATILAALTPLGYWVEWRLLNALQFGLPQNRERLIIIGHRADRPLAYLGLAADFQDLPPFLAVPWSSLAQLRKRFQNWGLAYNNQFIQADLPYFSAHITPPKLSDILEKQPDDRFYFTADTQARIQHSERVDRYINGVEVLYNQRGGSRMGYSIFGTNGVAPTLTCTTSRHYERYQVGNAFRRLTPVEYARLQGFSDHHCQVISPYHQYSLYGNAVPPVMIEWVLKQLLNSTGVKLSL